MKISNLKLSLFSIVLSFAPLSWVQSGELKSFHLTVKDGVFSPITIEIPAEEKIKLEVQNSGSTAEEFESVELNREKVLPPGATIILYIGPLSKGEYKFFGDFHKDSARGKIIVK